MIGQLGRNDLLFLNQHLRFVLSPNHNNVFSIQPCTFFNSSRLTSPFLMLAFHIHPYSYTTEQRGYSTKNQTKLTPETPPNAE